jgi:uncharacterized damage-inducible protein DinB
LNQTGKIEDMKDILLLYSEYNHAIDAELASLMEQIAFSELHAHRNTYHGSIYSLFYHLLSGSWSYLNAIYNLLHRKKEEIPPLPSDDGTVSTKDLSKLLRRLDELLIKLIRDLTEEDLYLGRKKLTIYNGRIVDMKVWQFFLQHITHQIHHQGQISLILDQLGIEHEFGNIFPLIPDSK